jgi:hypothetical protein
VERQPRQLLLHALALGQIAQERREPHPPAQVDVGDRQLDGEGGAI